MGLKAFISEQKIVNEGVIKVPTEFVDKAVEAIAFDAFLHVAASFMLDSDNNGVSDEEHENGLRKFKPDILNLTNIYNIIKKYFPEKKDYVKRIKNLIKEFTQYPRQKQTYQELYNEIRHQIEIKYTYRFPIDDIAYEIKKKYDFCYIVLDIDHKYISQEQDYNGIFWEPTPSTGAIAVNLDKLYEMIATSVLRKTSTMKQLLSFLHGLINHETAHMVQYSTFGATNKHQLQQKGIYGKYGVIDNKPDDYGGTQEEFDKQKWSDYYTSQVEFAPMIYTKLQDLEDQLKPMRSEKSMKSRFDEFVGTIPGITIDPFFKRLKERNPKQWKRAIKYLYTMLLNKGYFKTKPKKNIFEGQYTGTIHYRTENTASYSGQSNFRLDATDDQGEVLGYIEYVIYQGDVSVSYIKSLKPRMGIGTELLKQLQREYPGQEIDLGMMTDDGSKLIKSLKFKKVYSNKYRIMKKRLDFVNGRLAAMEKGWDDFGSLSSEQKEAIADEYRELDNEKYDLEQDLHDLAPYKKLIITE